MATYSDRANPIFLVTEVYFRTALAQPHHRGQISLGSLKQEVIPNTVLECQLGVAMAASLAWRGLRKED